MSGQITWTKDKEEGINFYILLHSYFSLSNSIGNSKHETGIYIVVE